MTIKGANLKGRLSAILKLTLQAIKGSEEDYTKLSINKAIFLLAVPMVVEMLMEGLFAIADIFFVAGISEEAVATVGLTESVMTLVYSIGIGLSMATTAMVARRIGEKKPGEASLAASQSILLAAGLSFFIAIAGIFNAREILELMGGSPELVASGYRYTAWMLGTNLIIMLLFLLNAIFRGAGDASLAMRSLIVANGLNIILDPILIYGLGPVPAMGLEGAAIATVIGRGTAVLYQSWSLLAGSAIVRLLAKNFVPVGAILWRLVKISAGGMGQFIIGSASWVFLIKIMSDFGTDALAGYTIAIRVIIFSILPSWGLANAAATLTGQNLGAGYPERAEASVWKCALYNMIFLGGLSVFFAFAADEVIMLFSNEPGVIAVGADTLRYVSLGYVFFAYGMVMLQAFNGAGDTLTPTLINLMGYWLIQIPLAWILAKHLDWQSNGVIWAIVIAEVILAVTSIFIFRTGRWKNKQV